MLGEETFLRYRRLVVFTVFFFFLWATSFWYYKGGLAEAASPVVTDIRIGTIGDVTRAVFEFTQQMGVKLSTLKNPYRIVLDLPEVGWRLPAKPLPIASGIFERLRYGLYKPGNSRLVLILRGPAQIANAAFIASNGAYGHRLVVELKPTTKATFHETMKKGGFSVASSTKREPS